MSSFMVYLILILDNVKSTSEITWMISLVLSIVIGIVWIAALADDDTPKSVKKFIKPTCIINGIIFFISLMVSTLLPNTKQMAAIIIVPKITNTISQNEELKKIPDNILKLANDWIVKLSPEESQPEQGK